MLRPARTSTLWTLFALALPVATLMACGGTKATNTPAIVVTPDELSFGDVPIGSAATVQLLVFNEGQATLQVADVLAETNTGYITVDWQGPILIEPGDEASISVTYAPESPEQTSGRLVLQTNDPGNQTLDVPVLVTQLVPIPSVFPSVIDFGIVAEGSFNDTVATVANAGTAPMIICNIFITGSPDITSDLEDTVASLQDNSGFVVLDPRGGTRTEFDIEMFYQPTSPGPDNSELILEYDTRGFIAGACAEDNTERVTFLIQGEAGTPSLQVSPDPALFGESPLDIERELTVSLTNAGELPLTLDTITLDAARTSGDFGIGELPELPLELAPEETALLILTYMPGEEGTDAGVLQIDYTDSTAALIRRDVTIGGIGVDAECPTAVAQAWIREDPQNRRGSEVDWGVPLQTLVLDGSSSFADLGDIADWEWTIVSRPEDAVNGIRAFDAAPDDPSLAQYLLPIAGRYVFELTVYDDAGIPSCEPARITVVATPQEAISVELTWTNPADPDEGDDEGSDVDLHFVKLVNAWSTTNDTYFGNTEPNWSPELPSLDRDDTDGGGPETVNLDNPEAGNCYGIGVHYFREAFGTAYPTIRVYVDGVLVDEMIGELRSTDDFWDAARIHWPSRTIYRVDDYYEGFNQDSAATRLTAEPTEAMIRNGHCSTL